jgi:hypothetical protein
MAVRYTLDDLPRYSPWPARLLGLEPWTPRQKTSSEVLREFDREKWGGLLARLEAAAAPPRVEEVDQWFLGALPETLCSVGDELELLSPLEAAHRQRALIARTLEGQFPAPALVELGAGYGSMLLWLAQQPPFSGAPIWAGELAASGLAALRRLAAAQQTPVEGGACDLASPELAGWRPPPGAVVYTSLATMYVPRLSPRVVEVLASWGPRAVVHFEPCWEHCRSDTLLGLLRRRYLELNDYNTNLVTLLHDAERQGRIRILDERPAVFGANPLLPISIVAWAPKEPSA